MKHPGGGIGFLQELAIRKAQRKSEKEKKELTPEEQKYKKAIAIRNADRAKWLKHFKTYDEDKKPTLNLFWQNVLQEKPLNVYAMGKLQPQKRDIFEYLKENKTVSDPKKLQTFKEIKDYEYKAIKDEDQIYSVSFAHLFWVPTRKTDPCSLTKGTLKKIVKEIERLEKLLTSSSAASTTSSHHSSRLVGAPAPKSKLIVGPTSLDKVDHIPGGDLGHSLTFQGL